MDITYCALALVVVASFLIFAAAIRLMPSAEKLVLCTIAACAVAFIFLAAVGGIRVIDCESRHVGNFACM